MYPVSIASEMNNRFQLPVVKCKEQIAAKPTICILLMSVSTHEMNSYKLSQDVSGEDTTAT